MKNEKIKTKGYSSSFVSDEESFLFIYLFFNAELKKTSTIFNFTQFYHGLKRIKQHYVCTRQIYKQTSQLIVFLLIELFLRQTL